MDLGLKDKNAIITGGSQGVGFAIAQGLAREGCNIAIGARGKEKLEEWINQLSPEQLQDFQDEERTQRVVNWEKC